MTPFRQAVYAAGLGEFALHAIDVASGRVEFVRVARERVLVLPDSVAHYAAMATKPTRSTTTPSPRRAAAARPAKAAKSARPMKKR